MIDIKPIKSWTSPSGYYYGKSMCDGSEVRELEADYKEAIEALKDLVIVSMARYRDIYSNPNDLIDIYSDQIDIIEKATGKSWKELTE